jgi:hypothetical protein
MLRESREATEAVRERYANRHIFLAAAIYRNRDWGLFTTEDKKVGKCYPFPNHELECSNGAGQLFASRLIRCESDYSAQGIEENSGYGR